MTPNLSYKRDVPSYIKRRIQPNEDRMKNDFLLHSQLDGTFCICHTGTVVSQLVDVVIEDASNEIRIPMANDADS